eukprot:900840-Pleurochrysis_carterae.AAC.1
MHALNAFLRCRRDRGRIVVRVSGISADNPAAHVWRCTADTVWVETDLLDKSSEHATDLARFWSSYFTARHALHARHAASLASQEFLGEKRRPIRFSTGADDIESAAPAEISEATMPAERDISPQNWLCYDGEAACTQLAQSLDSRGIWERSLQVLDVIPTSATEMAQQYQASV